MLANELCRKGYNIYILSWHRKGLPYFPCDKRITIAAMRKNFILWKLRYKKKLTIWLIRKYIRQHKIDVVIDVDTILSNETIPALKGLKTQLISWDHFNHNFCRQEVRRLNALSLIKRYANAMVVLTKADKEMYIKKEGIKENIIHQIYNPLTFEYKMPLTHYNKKVLAVGRFNPQKGFDILLKAWKIVEQEINDWTLEIWGYDGNDTGNVSQVFSKLNLQKASLHPTHHNIQEKFEDSSIYVLSSRYEGLGIVLLEASACALPLISFDCPNGPNEIIEDGINGYLVEPENTAALAQSIIKMIKDKKKRKRMGLAAYKKSKQFSLTSITKQWINLIENLC